ncbi:SDR family NAD(P)-dependent oxidoreductase [Mucilaginibacter flavus]|uniref:SDR family NAD(P)-dependent oxidoreductase n=1 Tax=Mucilaginibacter flavus TaxID=931504 RepID=UPI0025B50113|nr:SDR family NAD(P)-dependent oxidoreductase [Mucilaginibacter flavus]MDN3580458.1 SDR family NAD(P)-dependent oxidoreductase [Mucilaginibacter flavus]
MKKAIVVGATSGIGRQLAILLADNNYHVGITGRRAELLAELQELKPGKFKPSAFDVTDTTAIPQHLAKLTAELGGLDLLIISSGTGDLNPSLDPGIENETNAVNVLGFTTVADWAFNFFEKQGSGHLTAITSIAGMRGGRHAPAYNASKAYQINYLQALRQKATNLKLPIFVTDARPGFVDTPMAKGDGRFWVATPQKAALQIYKAIESNRKVVYITKRWRLIAFIIKHLPGFLYNRM